MTTASPASAPRGFTLIEFLIALVIIGFIVAILVNFFNNPMAEASLNKAVAKITDDTRILSDGFQKRYMDTTIEIDGLAELTTTSGLSTAPLSGLPQAPANAMTSGSTSTYTYVESDDAVLTGFTAWGNPATQDGVVTLGRVSQAVCDKINLNSGIAATPTETLDGTKDLQCFKWASEATLKADADQLADEYIVVKPLYIR